MARTPIFFLALLACAHFAAADPTDIFNNTPCPATATVTWKICPSGQERLYKDIGPNGGFQSNSDDPNFNICKVASIVGGIKCNGKTIPCNSIGLEGGKSTYSFTGNADGCKIVVGH